MNDEIVLEGGDCLQGELIPPGDKSISHRSVILGSLAKGESVFDHFLTSEDCLNTLEAFQKMGVTSKLEGTRLTIKGRVLWNLKVSEPDLDMGNSGTSTRLLLGVLSAQIFTSRFFGDASLSKRPMDRLFEPLRKMGTRIQGGENGRFLPLEIMGTKLKGIRSSLPVPIAHLYSC